MPPSNNPQRGGWLVAGTAVLAGAALVFAGLRWHASRESRTELESVEHARQARENLRLGLAIQLREAERMAGEAERDAAQLRTAVQTARRSRAEFDASSRPSASVAAEREPLLLPGTSPGTATAGSLAVVAGSSGDRSAPLTGEADPYVLAKTRAYHQDLARTRASEAKEKAAFDAALREVDAAERFRRRIERAQQQADRAEFSLANRTYQEAMREKPGDLPVPSEASQLHALLQAQSHPLGVTLVSDGATLVSVLRAATPARFERRQIQLPPGDYVILGSREGFADVRLPLQLRADLPSAEILVLCVTPAAKP